MAQGNAFNQAADENGKNNDLTTAMNQMSNKIHSLMSQRYKNDPKKANDEAEALLKKLREGAKTIQDLEKKSAAQRWKEDAKNAAEIARVQKLAATNFGEKIKFAGAEMGNNLKIAGANLASSLKKATSDFITGVGKEVDRYANMYGQYSAKINARLQTFDEHGGQAFEGLSKLIRKNLAASPYIKQEEMLKNLDSLISHGISYNVEQRAFLATLTDKIVTTFNSLDPILLRMIRLQQQDTTQARMGMEAYLTKYLNSTYEDTSYLDSLYDTVTSNLFEASSQLGKNASIELEYVVQKWLGSMSSVGVGDSFLSTISQGLGYLGSGNIDALQSNSSLQNLLVMAANRSGVDYSNILSQGLNADTANRLLSGIASYVNEISQNNNQIVRSQYAQLFGMTLSDMTAMLNLSSKDLVSISQNMLEYGDAISELESQLNDIGSRMYLSEMVNNVFSNFMTGVAGNIASNAGQYVTWKVADFIEQATGGIAIPTIGAFGSFIDLNTTATGLLKTGLVGYNVLDQIGNILTGLSSGGFLNLGAWGGKESTSRGSGFGSITSGYSSTTSTSTYIGSGSGSDIYSSSVVAAKDKAVEENKGTAEEEDILDLTRVIISILQSWDTGSGVKIDNTQALRVSIDSPVYMSGFSN